MPQNLNEWMMHHISLWFAFLAILGFGGWVLTRSRYAWSVVGAALVSAALAILIPRRLFEFALFGALLLTGFVVTFVTDRRNRGSDSGVQVSEQ